MSKISLQPNASGAGTFSIVSPDSNTNRTLTLPDESGAVLSDVSDIAADKLTGDIAADRMKDGFNASGSAPVFACRAWVNFNGTGTVAIRDSGNVSSITDNGTGQYTVNLTTAMPDVNCSPVVSGMRFASAVSFAGGVYANMLSTSAIRLFTGYEDTLNGQIPTDLEFVQVAIFR